MCLNRQEEIANVPDHDFGWKVFKAKEEGSGTIKVFSEMYWWQRPSGNFSPLLKTGLGLPLDKWLKCKEKIIADSRGEEYRSGWHLFLNRHDAHLWAGIASDLLVVEVEYKKVKTTGVQIVKLEEIPVIVADQILITTPAVKWAWNAKQ